MTPMQFHIKKHNISEKDFKRLIELGQIKEVDYELMEEYHQAKLKLLGIGDVSQQRELLNDFAKMMEDDYGFSATEMNMTEGVDIYLKSVNCG